LQDIAKAVPANFANAAKPISIAPAETNSGVGAGFSPSHSGNGHSKGNGNGAAKKTEEKAAEAVAGD